MQTHSTRRLVVVVTAIIALLVGLVPGALAAPRVDSAALRGAVTAANINTHLIALQAIAAANGGTRAAGTPGHVASAEYVIDQLDPAYFTVTRQYFDFALFTETSPAVLARTAPTAQTYVNGTDFATMEYAGAGDVTAAVVPTNDIVIPPGAAASTSNSGCEAADFPAGVAGNVALIQRGTCTFAQKALNAQAAGAIGVLIFNEGQPGRIDVLGGTLGGPGVTIPVVGTTYALGEQLYNFSTSGQNPAVHVATDTQTATQTTYNVIAETKAGRTDRVVAVGAHLDAVPEGPGIQDNGSGSMANLEIARQMAALDIRPTNQVRFIWFSAEEAGLLGSQYYVDRLSTRQIKDIAVMLNFDMIASPNFVRFIYDGDGSATGTAGPNGSKVAEGVFADYFASQGLATEPTAFDGRSDYGPFIAVGIPASGLFTGAEDIKTAQEAAIYGGTAGVAYDVCYHQACDTIANINLTALDQLSDAAAHAVYAFAMTTAAVNGTAKGKANGLQAQLEYWGPLARR